MKKTKILSLLLLVASVALFLVSQVKEQAADHTAPVISMDSDTISVSVEEGDAAVLSGVTAQDNRDGDVTDSLLVERLGTFIGENTRLATLAAVDAAGNVTKVTREVEYTDYTSPTFQLDSPLRFQSGSTEISSAVSAVDVLDGDISNKVKLTSQSSINSGDTGDFLVTFTVKNSAGDEVSMDATLTLYTSNDYTIPTINLSQYLIYIQQGETLDPWDYVESISVNSVKWTRSVLGNLWSDSSDEIIEASDVYVSDSVNSQEPGSYEISYSYTKNGKTGTVRLIVIVEE